MSETDESEAGSLVPIMASELYPKQVLESEDEALVVPFPPLCGESVQFLGRTADGVSALSNFRYFVRYSDSFVNIPLGLIDSIECRDIFYLYIYCKDARSIRCTFATNESCQDWYKRLSVALTHPTRQTQVFAFAFNAWSLDACSSLGGVDVDCGAQLCHPCDFSGYSIGKEIERLCFDLKRSWRISYANEDFKLCGTYPKLHLVPESISDKDLESVASFRTSRRFPSVVWRDVRTGAVLVRSSQPEVGWLGWRSTPDENLLQSVSKACSIDAGTQPQPITPTTKDEATVVTADSENSVKKMLIVDARSYAAAVANRAKGGGVECSEYYPNCEIQFMNLANIHTIRKSFHALRALCAAPADQPNWLSLLENTKWHVHISGLMRAALIVVNTIDTEGRPVLVHCSDGWDRTPQITALSELFLDPYYRTIEGFRVLVEKEWLEFGHKFADRCGHGVCTPDTNERCPVFLQFLDCVHQTLKQFPCAFQFNEAFLVKLVQHVYSCLFGTFLGNHTQGRLSDKVPLQTSSVWSLLQPSNTKFRNYLYTPHAHQILRPSYHMRHMQFWSAVYLSDATETMPAVVDVGAGGLPDDADLCADNSPSGELDPDQKLLTKTRSCDDLTGGLDTGGGAGGGAFPPPRRLSDPNIVTDPTLLLGKEAMAGREENGAAAGGVSEENENSVVGESESQSENKQIVIQEGGTRYRSSASPASDKDLNGEEVGPRPKDGVKNGPGAAVQCPPLQPSLSSAPVPQAISDREILKHSTADELPPASPSTLEKRSSSETAIETSTDTLTGDLDQTSSSAGSGDAKDPTRGHTGSDITNEVLKQDSEEGSEDDDKTCELTSSLNGGLPLHRSTTVSTSTTDISDSHVAGSLSQAHQKLTSSSPGVVSAQSMSLRLLRLHIPETTKVDYSVSQSMMFTQGVSGHSSSSSRDSDTYTPPTGQSRTPSSSSPTTPATECRACWRWAGRAHTATCALDQDGLVTWMSTGQARLVQMEAEYQTRIEQLQRQLHITRQALSHYASGASGALNQATDNQDNSSLADSQESGERASSLTSDMSWEPVEEKDAKMTLWVPDHAVTHCAGCDLEFWIVRRRHHCRNCGRVFCNECTSYSIPVPQQQLNTPVRVCRQCFIAIIAENPSMASTVITNGGMANGGGLASGSVRVTNGSGINSQLFNTEVSGCAESSNHFVFSNGHHGMMNGNGNLTTPTCNGLVANGQQQQADRQVTVTTS